MQPSDGETLTELWDAFAAAGFSFLSNSGEQRRLEKARENRIEQLDVRQAILSKFLHGELTLEAFKSQMNTESANHKLWGFNGYSGMMFFNILTSTAEADPETDLTSILRDVFRPPEDTAGAEEKIQILIDCIDHLKDVTGEEAPAFAPGHVPYFVSYFWQLDDPDEYPIYYSSMREALSELGIWTASGEHPTDYGEFWELNEEIRDLLEEHTGEEIHLWDIERLCQFKLSRAELATPQVWVEKSKPKWHSETASDFAYGQALWTPQRSADGKRIFETLRELTVGDIVLHLSLDDETIVGVSVVDSELITDFEVPADAMWEKAQRERGGYLRELRDFSRIEPPLDVTSELLAVDWMQPTLQSIAEDHSVFFTNSLGFAPQSYLTEAPPELVELLTRSSAALREQLDEFGYPEQDDLAGEYENVAEAVSDVERRIDPRAESQLFGDSITSTLIGEWTAMLVGFEPSSDISTADEVRGKQILSVFDSNEEAFQTQALEGGVGHLPPLSPAETLFMVLFREFQAVNDLNVNFNQVKYNVLRNEAYTVQPPDPVPEPIDGDPLPTAPMPDQGAHIRDLLIDVRQLVFYGPPGTGKTYTAQRFARWWLNEVSDESTQQQLETVTFHPSFSYEDFIEGLTARKTDDGGVAYEIESGVFKRIAERARDAYQADPESPTPFVLVIDEINRGNLAQIFGETITALEADKRLGAANEVRISLAHSRASFTVPPNLYVIGTMNTADQSIALVDTALRRRFRFIDFPPDLGIVFGQYDTVESMPSAAVQTRSEVISRFERLLGASVLAVEALNDRMLDSAQLGKGKQLGHSYLLGHESTADLVNVWRYELLPQLEEYYFGQFGRLREELLPEADGQLIDWEHERIRAFDSERLYGSLCALADIDDPAPLAAAAEAVSDGSGSSEERADSVDAWAAGERTVDTFRNRVRTTLDEESAAKIEKLLDGWAEIGTLEAGDGERTATVMLKSDAVDPTAAPFRINEHGRVIFELGYLRSRDRNSLTGEFMNDAAQAFTSVSGFSHEWNPAGEEGEKLQLPTLDVHDLSDRDIASLVEGFHSFVEQAADFQRN